MYRNETVSYFDTLSFPARIVCSDRYRLAQDPGQISLILHGERTCAPLDHQEQ